MAPLAATHTDPNPSTVLTAQPVALPGTAGSCRGWSGRMPAPSLLIICLPSQTKVALCPSRPARGSRQGAWSSKHGDQEQQPVPASAWTQHPNPALLPWLLPAALASPAATASAARLAGWLWEEVGVLIMQKGEGRRRRRREAEREKGREKLWLEEDKKYTQRKRLREKQRRKGTETCGEERGIRAQERSRCSSVNPY